MRARGLTSVALGDSALLALNLIIILEDLRMLQTLVWVLNATLDFRNHTDPVPVPLEPPRNWPARA